MQYGKTIVRIGIFFWTKIINGDNMKIRLGYVALPVTIPITASKTITLTTYKKLGKKRGEEKRTKVFEENIENFIKILKYNEVNQIHFYRMTSHLVPLLTYPDSYDNILKKHRVKLKEIGKYIQSKNMRVDMHPDQYLVLNSINPIVVKSTISSLNYYDDLMNTIGLNTNIILHIGSSQEGKIKAMKRFEENFKQLRKSIQEKIALENDDKIFNIRNTLNLSKRLNVPMVLDYHHFLVNRNNEKIEDYIVKIFSTWKTTPKIHFSSPKNKKEIRSHHDYIDSDTFIDFIEKIKFCDIDFDVMIEAKQKDEALFRLVRELKYKTNYEFLDETTFIVK